MELGVDPGRDSEGQQRDQVSRELYRLAAVTLTGPAGTVVQTTEPTDAQRGFLAACKVSPPPRITALTPR